MKTIMQFVALAMLGGLLFNVITMVVSPRFWFDLPPYLSFRGTMRRSLLATWHGQLQIRALGFLGVLFAGPIVRDIVRTVLWSVRGDRPLQQQVGETLTDGRTGIVSIVSPIMAVITTAALVGYGAMMVFWPNKYFDKYFDKYLEGSRVDLHFAKYMQGSSWADQQPTVKPTMITAIRVLGLMPLGLGLWLGWISINYLLATLETF